MTHGGSAGRQQLLGTQSRTHCRYVHRILPPPPGVPNWLMMPRRLALLFQLAVVVEPLTPPPPRCARFSIRAAGQAFLAPTLAVTLAFSDGTAALAEQPLQEQPSGAAAVARMISADEITSSELASALFEHARCEEQLSSFADTHVLQAHLPPAQLQRLLPLVCAPLRATGTGTRAVASGGGGLGGADQAR